MTVGDGIVTVTQADIVDENEGNQMLGVKLLADGLEVHLDEVSLVDAADQRVASSGGGSSSLDNRQQVNLSFPLGKISGDPDRCHLAFKLPGTGETTIGPLGDLAPKTTPAGATKVRVTQTGNRKLPDGRDFFEVTIEFDGFAVFGWGVAALVGESGVPLPSSGWGGGGNLAQFRFDSAQMREKAESYRIRLEAPTRVTEHVLRAEFRDIILDKPARTPARRPRRR